MITIDGIPIIAACTHYFHLHLNLHLHLHVPVGIDAYLGQIDLCMYLYAQVSIHVLYQILMHPCCDWGTSEAPSCAGCRLLLNIMHEHHPVQHPSVATANAAACMPCSMTVQVAIQRGSQGLLQGIKGTPVLNDPREKEHARVRNHLMRALNADTVAASIWQLSDTVQRSITAISQGAADRPEADEGPQRGPNVYASAPPQWWTTALRL